MHDLGIDIRQATKAGHFKHLNPVGRPDWESALEEVTARARKIGYTLIVVDSLAKFTNSIGLDPDRTSDALTVMSALHCLVVSEECCLIVIAHPKKPKGDNQSWSSAVEYMANNHQITDQATSAVVLTPTKKFAPGKSGAATVIVTKDRHGAIRSMSTDAGSAAVFLFNPGPVETLDGEMRMGMFGAIAPPPEDPQEADSADAYNKLVVTVRERIPDILSKSGEFGYRLTKNQIKQRLSEKQRAALDDALQLMLAARELAEGDNHYALPNKEI
jgi:hypothetical protein